MPNALSGSSKQRVAGSNPAGRTTAGRTSPEAIRDLRPRVRRDPERARRGHVERTLPANQGPPTPEARLRQRPASFSSGCATLVRASYLLAVVTLIHHSRAIIRPTEAMARATRHPAVHALYQPIQFGCSRFTGPAACQATVLMVTAAAALTNCTVAAMASNLSSACAI